MSQGPAGATWVTGVHAVTSALEARSGRVLELRITADCANSRVHALAERARREGIAVSEAPRRELDRLADGGRHQDIAARFEAGNLGDEGDLDAWLDAVEGAPLVLVLDGVQDPHNLGACLRTADAAGVDVVIVPKDRASGLTPVVRKAASGAAERIRIVQATNLARVLRRLKERGIWLTGFSDAAEDDLYAADLAGPAALVLGSEGRGMRRLTAETCDFLVRIPMAGRVGSLNVSVAAAVALYEAVRQRRGGAG
jgi:23S rRNA (guanosine2251-2'-O)-methyltransferase